MKRQLERLKGKRLVTGDANLMTKNEICINTTSDGGVEVKEIGVDGKIKDLAGSGGSSSSDMEYYKTPAGMEEGEFIALYKLSTTSGIRISGLAEERANQTVAIAYAPITSNSIIYYSLKDYFRELFSHISDEEFEIAFNAAYIPITKEEFYDLNNI